MENKIVFLLIAIIVVWILLNPKSRAYIKESTGKIFGGSEAAANGNG